MYINNKYIIICFKYFILINKENIEYTEYWLLNRRKEIT
jgi:hypothetical protein